MPPSHSLLEVWTQVLEAEEKALPPGTPNLLLRTSSERKARNLRAELYRFRARARAKSKKGLSPSDQNYNTTPWDPYRIELSGPELKIFRDDEVSLDFEIIPQGIVEIALPKEEKKSRRRKEEPS